MTKTISELAQYYAKQFTTVKRGDETIVVLKDKHDDELQKSVYNAHGDKLPDDWIFSKYLDCIYAIADTGSETLDELEDNRHEIIDGLVDVYTADLTSWLNSHNENVYYLTEALEECEQKNGFQLLAYAQSIAIGEIYDEVVKFLGERMEEQDNG